MGEESGRELESLDRKIEEMREMLLARRSADLSDFSTFLSSKRRLTTLNFIMGLSRGVGFFLGMSLLGAVLVGGLAWAVDLTASTFRSNYDTRSLVRAVTHKYSEVMDEVERVRQEKAGEASSSGTQLPSASGAQIGAALLSSTWPADESSTEEKDG